MTRIHPLAWLPALLLAASFALPAAAEPPPAKDWEVELLGYGWMPAVDGSIEKPRGGTEHFSVGAKDILEDLQIAAMARANVRWRRWIFIADGLWTKLDQDLDVQRNNLRIDADIELQMAFAQLLGGFRLYSRPGGLFREASPERTFGLDLVGGANYSWLSLDIELDRSRLGPIASNERQLDASKDWFAPAVGLRLQNDLTSRIRLETLATAGGFSVGDAPEISWQVTTLLSWRFTEHWFVSAGHKVIAADDDSYDVRLHGAMIGVGYRF